MYKVLLVDDETINYQLFEKLVDWREKGFEIVGTAADGQEAIRRYEELAPDLIFMDIQLPFMDGLECVRCIRESDKTVKIVIVSAYGDFSYAQRAIRYDVQDFLLKPVSRLLLNQLVDRMREELDTKIMGTEDEDSNNIWTETGQNPVITGIFMLDEQGRLLQRSKVKKAVGDLLKHPGLQTGLLGCIVLEDGNAILLWDRQTFAMEVLVAATNCLIGYVQIYLCDQNEVDIKRWMEQFLQKENYGFYDKPGGIYHLEEPSFADNEIQIEKSDQWIAEAIAVNSADHLMQMIETVFTAAKNDNIHPQILKDTVLNLLVQVKSWLRKFEQQESFLLMRNVRLENIHNLHTAEGLKCFLQEKISTTFLDIDESFYQPGRRIVFRTNAFTQLHYREISFSVQMAADHMGISRNYFTSQYKDQAGIGFWEYVTKLRMEAAAELLVTTDQMTREIGREVGYESEYHFSRKFKEYSGESPNNYRKSRSNK